MIDVSFISLTLILPNAVALLKPDGVILALIKPQFEAGKAEADKGAGVITDAAVHARVLRELEEFVGSGFRVQGSENPKLETRNSELKWLGGTESPLLGPAGNKEFLVLLEKTG